MKIDVRDLHAADIDACRQLLEELPDWFGMEESNREYIGGLSQRPSAVAVVADRVAGFISIERHDAGAAEVHVMAVDPKLHRAGIGTELLSWVERWGEQRGVRWLHVKTRGPSTPDEGYEKTRHFYLAKGFEPLFETLELWGPENAALILIKTLSSSRAG
jgi:GNAT superfamily N-acetyltransferase